MRIKNIQDQLVYVPNKEVGYCEFKGDAIPTSDIIEQIGMEGVEHISEKFRQLIDSRKEMFGRGDIEDYGLSQEQLFFDLKGRNFLKAEEIITGNDDLHWASSERKEDKRNNERRKQIKWRIITDKNKNILKQKRE